MKHNLHKMMAMFVASIFAVSAWAQDYTSAIQNADLSISYAEGATSADWNLTNSKGIKDGYARISGKVFDFSQTITLPAGQYKMTAKAAYRFGGDEQAEYDAIQAGGNTHLAKLYAETSSYKYEVEVMNRYEGAAETDYANGNGSVTVNGLLVPNSSAAVKAWFDANQYVNELVFNVQAEGAVKIGIAKAVEASDYTNIGAWTLTRVGDAEADPKAEEPTPGPEEPGDDNEQAWVPSAVGNGVFYLYNVGAQKYMCSGNAWGSQASIAEGGVPMTLAGEGDVYTISSVAIYKDGFLGLDGQQNAFMDCGATNWTFEAVAENVYKIKIGDKVLFWPGDANTHLNYGDDPNTEASQWMLYTEEARIAQLANATSEKPIDATFLIKNAYFAKGNGRWVAKDADLTNSPSWKGTSLTDLWGFDHWNAEAAYAVEQYGKEFDNYQELTNIPNGMYHMTAKGFYRGDVVPYIYANDKKCNLKVKGDIGGDNLGNAAKALLGDDYLLDGVNVTVEDGTLRVGVKSDEKIDWCVFDDFKLVYYGNPEDPAAAALAQKKEAFLARAETFRAFMDNNVNWSLQMINQTYLYPVSDEVLGDEAYGIVGLVDKMDEVTDIETLEYWMAEMDKVEALLAEANVAAAEFAKWQALIQHAAGFAATYDEATVEAAMMYMEFSVGYNCATVEAINEAAVGAEEAYKNFVFGATPVEGEKFDVTFLIQNPNFDKNMDGWQTVNAGHNGGEGYNGVGGIAEIAQWGAESWDASMSQTITGLPNGKYVVKMAWMAATGIEMALSANTDTVKVVGIGDQGGNIAKDGTVVGMGQGHRGWQYAEVEGVVMDSVLTIAVNSSSTVLHTWSNADAFELYYVGDLSFLYELDEPIEGEWEDVTNKGAWPIIDHAELLGLGDYWMPTNHTRYDEERGVMEFVAGDNTEASLIQEYCPFGQATYRLTGKAFHSGAVNAVMFVGDQTVEIPAAAEGATFENAEEHFTTFSIEFTCEAAWGTQLNVGYSCEFDNAEDFLVVGGLKLEEKKSTTLAKLFTDAAMAYESLGYEIYQFNDLYAEHQELMPTVMVVFEAVMGGQKILKSEVEKTLEDMEAKMAKINAVLDYYRTDFMETVGTVEAIQLELPEASEAYLALAAAIETAFEKLSSVTAVEDFDALVAALNEALKVVPTGVALDCAEVTIDAIGGIVELIATVEAEEADQAVTWVSSNDSVATVDENGVVTAVAEGVATITVTTVNGLTDSCVVTVAVAIEVVEITLNMDSINFTAADSTVQLIATVSPEDAADQTITWTSSDEAVATVDAEGNVTSVAAGSAVITATAANGVTAECVVTVVITNGIENIYVDGELVIYDLQGRRVQKMEKGLYIVNGKKVLVK